MSLSVIRPRRDTITNWEAADPILLEGEMGIGYPTSVNVPEDGCIIKFGDGAHAWNQLPTAITDNITLKIIKTFPTISDENPVLQAGMQLDVLMASIKKKFEYVENTIGAIKTMVGVYSAMNINNGAGGTVTANTIVEALQALETYKLHEGYIYNGDDSTNAKLALSANRGRQLRADLGAVANLPTGYSNAIAAIAGLNSNLANLTIPSSVTLNAGAYAGAHLRLLTPRADSGWARPGIGFECEGISACYLYYDGNVFRYIDNQGTIHTITAS